MYEIFVTRGKWPIVLFLPSLSSCGCHHNVSVFFSLTCGPLKCLELISALQLTNRWLRLRFVALLKSLPQPGYATLALSGNF